MFRAWIGQAQPSITIAAVGDYQLTKRVAGRYLFDHDYLAHGQLEQRLNGNPEARVHPALRILPGASAADAIPRH